ncbi:unnamed protein product [Cylindrotheca closterium]|uniref:Programmed cell death protein 2 C-terminal domain-containing protein n=1 Tax=Cylindrotheca closterium TaxID=2856 RepID=A0AAD2FIK4_9STRA|nr:unnamed protein product [Cylindrotheca closterium]
MWGNNDDYSDNGEPVKLYVPTQGPPRKNSTAPIESHIGGVAFSELGPAPTCQHCDDNMKLLVQLYRIENQMERFLTVYGCPQSACFSKLKFENGFSYGNGVMSCRMLVRPIREKPKPSAPAAPVKSSWYSDDGDDMDNDWGADTGSDNDVADLESKIAAMEANLEDGAMPKKEAAAAKTPKGTVPTAKVSPDSFPCYMLNQQVEPPAPRQQIEEDDVGMGASDDKIRNMLARYMAEEEDEDILAALSGTAGGGGGAGGEADERLSEEDRILLGFQDRLRRAPRQVVRYAPGGIPMWSIPTEAPTVPSSPDGNPRSFECQLLPPLLLTLNVDKFSGAEQSESGINGMLSDGMNWGSVAVFTRANPTSEVETEEVLLIQKSVDEMSEMQGQPKMDLEPAIAVVEDMDDDDEFTPDA